MKRLDLELMVLFGRDMLRQAERGHVDLDAIEPDAVAGAARQLLEAKGQPAKQRAIVQNMGKDLALALCAWIRTPEMHKKWSHLL